MAVYYEILHQFSLLFIIQFSGTIADVHKGISLLSFSSYTKLLNLENVSVPYDIDFMEGFAIRKVKEYFLNIIMPSNCKRKIFHVKCRRDHFPSLTKITKLSSCDACEKEARFTRA